MSSIEHEGIAAGAQADTERIRRQAARVARVLQGRARQRRRRRLLIASGCAAALLVAVGVGFASSPWPPGVTVRHIVAAPSCERARMVRLAPALRGEPGYWDRHDRNGNGVACEYGLSSPVEESL
ncbi:excalibur calcium-binding domain-containing protein [Lutibaculum baratangense]|uniref:Excalibur calcium-binding domain-containing protein n=1 Tax=Lutibaculum baratangense AMV1 TaxID=631454 RepID=V4RIK8_9HYPH|nr:excalibur calcium-binding domain-containing protein [Lutibaculum baratangense]ESR25921.1 hypothetical protein N177_1256 [Lutibaculum baratangense AMV1]